MNSGIFEYDNYVLIRQWIRPNSTYFDVGSNIGVMAIPFLKENPTCFVASFEPSPLTYSFLQLTHAGSGSRRSVITNAAPPSQSIWRPPLWLADIFGPFQDRVLVGKARRVLG